jgi:hypothetical protein
MYIISVGVDRKRRRLRMSLASIHDFQLMRFSSSLDDIVASTILNNMAIDATYSFH